MASPKPPDDEEELCIDCGMPLSKMNSTIPISLLFSKATRQVLCLEAGKEFVDALMGFLTLPVGCIIKLLEGATMIHRPESKGGTESGERFSMSSISNIFGSVLRLDDKEMSARKNCLVDPKPLVPFGAGKLLDLHGTPAASTDRSMAGFEGSNYYGCGSACNFYSSNPGTKCPEHKKKMVTPFKVVEPGQAASESSSNTLDDASSQASRTRSTILMTRALRTPIGQEQPYSYRGRQCSNDACASKPRIPPRSLSRLSTAKPAPSRPRSEAVRRPSRGVDVQLALPSSPANPEAGYVKEGTRYMITNTLEIHASSEAIRALITLNIIRCERVGDLETMPVSVVKSEILQLLKSSFTSSNVLNDVFGKYCADAKTVVLEEEKEAFSPQGAEKPSCQCSRMGTPMNGQQG